MTFTERFPNCDATINSYLALFYVSYLVFQENFPKFRQPFILPVVSLSES